MTIALFKDYQKAKVENDFTYHDASEYAGNFQNVRAALKAAAYAILENCPIDDDQKDALKYLNHAMFLANASIARQSPITKE